MIEHKKKICSCCNTEQYLFSRGRCKSCAAKEDGYGLKTKLKPYGDLLSSSDVAPPNKNKAPQKPLFKAKKVTGELELFKEIYEEVKGICQLTGRVIPFNVRNFAHVLSKGAYNSLRLYKSNILHIDPRAHHLYDCSSKEKLLSEFPTANLIYELKDKLRYEYYNK